MKTIVTLMAIAIVMASIGMASIGMSAAVGTPEDGLLIGMTTQEYVDYYGMKYLEGDRSKCTVETLALFAEKYDVHPTMDITVGEPVPVPTAEVTEVTVLPDPVEVVVSVDPVPTDPVDVTPEPVETPDDDGSLVLPIIVIGIIVAFLAYVYTARDDEK